MIDALMHDLGFAWRAMLRAPGFTTVAVVMIALGTGANAAMFSIVDSMMLRSPFPDADRLAIVLVGTPGQRPGAAVSLTQYRSLLESAPAFEAVGAMSSSQRPAVGGLGAARRLNTECISAGMFRTLGTPALQGRTFTAGEDRAGGPGTIVLSYQFWQRELGGAPDVVGRAITLNGTPATVVGIMPPRFGGPYSRNNNDGWLPLGPALGGVTTTGCIARGDVDVFVRVKPRLSLEAAAAQATASAGIARIPDWRGRLNATLTLISLERQTLLSFRAQLLALVGAVALVLLIACANVANLQLERVFGRRRELAVRLAIGATRGRIVRQCLMENLVLCVLGGIAGAIAARATLHLLVGLMPANVPRVSAIDMSVRILVATLGVSCLAGAAVGLVPALQASSTSMVDDLRQASPTSTAASSRTRRVLVAGQIALSLTLLVGAVLMIRTFLTLRPDQPGFAAADKLTGVVRLQGPSAPAPLPYFARLLDRLRAIPGVEGVSGSSYLPMSGLTSSADVVAGGSAIDIWTVGFVTANYFDEMRIPLSAGRSFDAHDDASAPAVAIVNEAFARRAWPTGNPVGETIDVQRAGVRTRRQIVGVIRDTRVLGSSLRSSPEVYIPFAQSPGPLLNVIIRARNPADPRLGATVSEAAAAIDPSQVIDRMSPYQAFLDSRVASPRFGAWVLGLFAAMAVLLAAVGLAASIAWWVTQRTREIGVRMALGAKPTDVSRMVVRQAAGIAAAGIALGLTGAAASTRLIASWLYGVTPLDLPTFAWSAVAMLTIAIAASYIPVRRAARVDPLVALRAE
jgi:putative ABC transport system permease protein